MKLFEALANRVQSNTGPILVKRISDRRLFKLWPDKIEMQALGSWQAASHVAVNNLLVEEYEYVGEQET